MIQKNDAGAIEQTSLNEEALEWVVLLTSGEVTPEKIEKCQQWRQRSNQHELAFIRARKLWLNIGHNEDLQHFNDQIQAIVAHPPSNYSLVFYFFHSYKYLLIIIFSILCVCAALINSQYDYMTKQGEIKVFDLEDHSRMTLNTNTALDLNFSAKHREVIFDKGEAYFEIKQNALRPLTIKSGKYLIEAQSTAFVLKKNRETTIITVLNGNVILTDNESGKRQLNENQKIIVNDDQPDIIQKIHDKNFLSWTQGNLYFKNESIEEIFDILKDYDKKTWIVYMSQRTKNTHLSTTINIHHIDTWIKGLSTITPIRTLKLGRILIIYSS